MEASRYPEAAFLAAVTASATHELRNVLAITKESAGLLEDLLGVARQRGALNEEKMAGAVARIDAQVKRGADLLTHLNRLAHSLDQDTAEVELRQELEEAVFLGQRLARGKGQRMAVAESPAPVPLTLSPLRLQMVLFAALELCLEAFPEGAAVAVAAHPGEGEGGGVVEMRGVWEGGGEVVWPPRGEGWSRLEGECMRAGARAQASEEGIGLRIRFPQGSVG